MLLNVLQERNWKRANLKNKLPFLFLLSAIVVKALEVQHLSTFVCNYNSVHKQIMTMIQSHLDFLTQTYTSRFASNATVSN